MSSPGGFVISEEPLRQLLQHCTTIDTSSSSKGNNEGKKLGHGGKNTHIRVEDKDEHVDVVGDADAEQVESDVIGDIRSTVVQICVAMLSSKDGMTHLEMVAVLASLSTCIQHTQSDLWELDGGDIRVTNVADVLVRDSLVEVLLE
ncbi:hypothetical protein SARC_11316, partial [Sphaeroforma arctica JP610]